MIGLGAPMDLVLLAVASGTLSLALTVSHITKPLRHEYMDAPFMIGELINCPYCMGHWTALPMAWLISTGLVSFVLNWLIIVGLSCLFIGAVQKLFLFRESENEDLRETIREAHETVRDLVERKA